MNPRNRLHTLTRWPSDPRRRLELAEIDISFAAAISKVMGEGNPVVRRIAVRAFEVKFAAQQQLEKKKC